jgi:hypothetical protein
MAKVSGKAGTWTYHGVQLNFKTWSADFDRTNVESTDSANYDAGTDMVWQAQIPVKLAGTVEVEGNFDKSTTNANIMADLFSGVAAQPTILKIDASTTFGHGNCDLSKFKTTLEVEGMVSFTATLQTNGVFVGGS